MNVVLNNAAGLAGRNKIGHRSDAADFEGVLSTPVSSASSPFSHFAEWFGEAVNGGVAEPNAMVLATASASGMPSARIVLLHSFSGSGFVFYTDRDSRKCAEIDANPKASILFYWKEMQRQVRVEGTLAQLSADPAARRLTEAAEGVPSEQDAARCASLYLTKMFNERLRRWANARNVDSPRWCAFELAPEAFEFWEGRADGSNDRKFYRRVRTGWASSDNDS